MRKIFLLILLTLMLPSVFSCSAFNDSRDGQDGKNDVTDGQKNDLFTMKATVKDVGEKIEVDVTEAEYAEGIYWIVTSTATDIRDQSENVIAKSDLSAGDFVEITYNGQVMMSYPPQVVAISIRKI